MIQPTEEAEARRQKRLAELEQRRLDAEQRVREERAAVAARDAKTARLRALRLAHEAKATKAAQRKKA